MGRKTLFLIITAIVIAVILGVLIMIRALLSLTPRKAPEVIERKTTIEAVDILNDPLVYDGLRVEVDAQVLDWVTKRSFTVLALRGSFGGADKQLLVVSKTPFRLPKDAKEKELGIGETEMVKMKGRVRIMDKVELGRVLGLDLSGKDIKLDDNNIANWREGSVLLLSSVEKL